MIMATRAVPHLKTLQERGAARVRETGSHEAIVAMDSQPHNGREAGGERKGTNTGARSPAGDDSHGREARGHARQNGPGSALEQKEWAGCSAWAQSGH